MKRVLVVDDEPQVLAGIRRSIGRHFDIDAVASADEAIERMKRGERYSAILSDLAMADVDGLMFLEQARALAPWIPRIMLTGHADRTAVIGAINRAGVAAFLHKPTTPAKLRAALERAILESPSAARTLPATSIDSRQTWIARELAATSLRKHFKVLFQPRICTRRGTLAAAEALLRWTHPQHGPIAPAEFIPIAEQTGQIDRITAWVLRETVDAWQQLRLAGMDLPISVNLSPSTILSSDLVQVIVETLTSGRMPACQLELEITESYRLERTDAVQGTLSSLKSLGVRTALDDFGTGYASLDSLRALEIDILKIDRSFVAGLGSDRKHHEIVRSITDLARSLDLTVVAEGVETMEQATPLIDLGVQQLQGYLFAPALAIDQLRSRELAGRIELAATTWQASARDRST